MPTSRTELYTYLEQNAKYVRFEQGLNNFNLDLLKQSIEAIKAQKPLVVQYQDFFNNHAQYTIHPYQIREYRERYYLIGHCEEYDKIFNIALDRTQSITQSEVAVFKPNTIDLDAYFGQVVGITVYSDAQQETVVLKASLTTAEFLRTKPLHHTQAELEATDTHVIFEYTLKTNWELKAEIMRLGAAVEVLAPAELRSEIAKEVDNLSEIYLNE